MPNDRNPETKKEAVSSEVRKVDLKISCLLTPEHGSFVSAQKARRNRDAIGEIVYAIVKSGGYINDVHKKTLKEMGFML